MYSHDFRQISFAVFLLPFDGKNELDFTEINLDDGNEREKFTDKYPYLRTSPQIFCDGENIGGFTDLLEEDPNDLR